MFLSKWKQYHGFPFVCSFLKKKKSNFKIKRELGFNGSRGSVAKTDVDSSSPI